MKILVTSAVPLTTEQTKKIESAFVKNHPKSSIDFRVDPSCIGGIKVTIGSKQIDMTLQSQLHALEKALLA